MLERYEFIQDFVWMNLMKIIFMILFPYFVRWFIIIFADFLNTIIRMPKGLPRNHTGDIELPGHRKKVYRFLSFLFFPGALIRITMIYGYLVLQGWKVNTSYKADSNLSNNTIISDKNNGGFFLFMKMGNRQLTMKDAIVLTSLCYIPLLLGILMLINHNGTINFVNYVFDKDFRLRGLFIPYAIFNLIVYWYLVLALIIGGAPVPEETSLIVYYILATYPHIIISEMLIMIVAVFISYMDVAGPYSSDYLGMVWFYLLSLLTFTKALLDDKKVMMFEASEFQFDTLLDTITLF